MIYQTAEHLILNHTNPTNFFFTLEKFPDFSYMIVDTTIPDVSIGVINKQNPFYTEREPGTSIDFGELRFTFVVDENLSNYINLFRWMLANKDFSPLPENQQLTIDAMLHLRNQTDTSEGVLYLLSNKKNIVSKIAFHQCWVKNLSNLGFSTRVDPDTLFCDATLLYSTFDFTD